MFGEAVTGIAVIQEMQKVDRDRQRSPSSLSGRAAPPYWRRGVQLAETTWGLGLSNTRALSGAYLKFRCSAIRAPTGFIRTASVQRPPLILAVPLFPRGDRGTLGIAIAPS